MPFCGALGGEAVGGGLQRVLEALEVVQRGRQRGLLRAVCAALARHATLQRRYPRLDLRVGSDHAILSGVLVSITLYT